VPARAHLFPKYNDVWENEGRISKKTCKRLFLHFLNKFWAEKTFLKINRVIGCTIQIITKLDKNSCYYDSKVSSNIFLQPAKAFFVHGFIPDTIWR